MNIYNISGGKLIDDYILVGAVLDASSDDNRYAAMKQLLDIGVRRVEDPNCTVRSSDFDKATAGAVCVLPRYNSSLYDGYPFEILFSKDKDVQHGPASVTKIMTLATGLPFIASLDERITFVDADQESGTGAFYNTGDIISVYDIMYAIMMQSSNTCAKAFARYVGAKLLGDLSATPADCLSAFCAEMNRNATAIGCTNSYFDSPSGYSGTTLTTASDLLRIVIHAASFIELNNVWNKSSHTIHIEGDDPRTLDATYSIKSNATINTNYHIFGGKPGSASIGMPTPFRALAIIAQPKR